MKPALNVHLRIIGEALRRPACQMLQNLNGIHFSRASQLSVEVQLQAEYAAADLLLFCSTLEGFGMPIIEAQISGRPRCHQRCAPPWTTRPEAAPCWPIPKDITAINSESGQGNNRS